MDKEREDKTIEILFNILTSSIGDTVQKIMLWLWQDLSNIFVCLFVLCLAFCLQVKQYPLF